MHESCCPAGPYLIIPRLCVEMRSSFLRSVMAKRISFGPSSTPCDFVFVQNPLGSSRKHVCPRTFAGIADERVPLHVTHDRMGRHRNVHHARPALRANRFGIDKVRRRHTLFIPKGATDPADCWGFGRVIRQFKIRSLRIHSRECCPGPAALAHGGDIARQAVCVAGVCLPAHLAPSAATTRRSFRSRTDRTKASVSRRHSRGLVVGVSRSVQIADVLIGKSLGIDFRMHRIGIYLATCLVGRGRGGVRGWA